MTSVMFMHFSDDRRASHKGLVIVTVVPTKSDNDVILCLQLYTPLDLTPSDRINTQVMYRF